MNKGSYRKILGEILASKLDIKIRYVKNIEIEIAFLYISQLTNKGMLDNDIIKPTNICIKDESYLVKGVEEFASLILSNCELFIGDQENEIINHILRGMTVMLFSNESKYIVLNTRQVEKRGIALPELTYTLRGSRDAFNENIEDNLTLVRYRIKDAQLNINNFELGRRTKTKVAVLHIGDIVNEKIVEEVIKRLEKIDVDGIINSGELQNAMLNKRTNIFPQMGIVERSDMAAGALLEGKVIILVDGNCLALVAPKLFAEFFVSSDDLYDNRFMALLAKYIRVTATLLSVTITALYVAILSFHIDTLPVDFINIINESMKGVPFTIFVGALLMEIIAETLRESLLRVPKQIGSAVGVVGGIVIGQAAIAAKVFSPLTLIVGSITLLASFAIPDYTIMNPLKIMKFFLIFASGSFGLIGFTLGISIVLINIVSTNTFGLPYLEPIAPYNWYDLKNSLFFGKDISPLRQKALKTKDKIRSKP